MTRGLATLCTSQGISCICPVHLWNEHPPVCSKTEPSMGTRYNATSPRTHRKGLQVAAWGHRADSHAVLGPPLLHRTTLPQGHACKHIYITDPPTGKLFFNGITC